MDQCPQDVYANCLPNDRGHPLWSPEPSSTSILPSSYGLQHGPQICDLGYVSREGAFRTLFNVSRGPSPALRRRSGISSSFDPVALDAEHQVDIRTNADPPGRTITSRGIIQPSHMSQRVGHYEFIPSSAEGAILILPDGATSYELADKEPLRKVAMQRAYAWYEFAREHFGENLSNSSLYLITGTYKAPSWSLASFRDAVTAEHRQISVVPREGEGTSAGRDWRCTFPVQHRDGPGPGHNGEVNQCVFVSGFKVAIRDDVLAWLSQKPEVSPVPAVRLRKGIAGFLAWLFGRKWSFKQRRRANAAAGRDHASALSQPFHPADAINRYLLKKVPDALVAVTHDSECVPLVEAGIFTSKGFTQECCLDDFLSENYSLVSRPEDSGVYPQRKCRDVGNLNVTSNSEESWYGQPFTADSQVVVTGIRAEDVLAGFKRRPVGFYVLVESDGTKRRTENKPVCLYDSAVEWDDRIQLPFEPSAKVQFSVCASFEFSPTLGNGEVLRTVEVRVGDLTDNVRSIAFPPAEGGLVSPCSSILLTMERQRSHRSGIAPGDDASFDWELPSDLVQLTNQGHNALLRHRCDDPRKENAAVAVRYFEHALAICPPCHPCYAAALCNLARAHFTYCQADCGPMELLRCISCYLEALNLRKVGHLDRPATLLQLAEVLLYRYGKIGFEDYPGKIPELISEVHASCSVDSHEYRAADLALQTYTLYNAISTGGLVDVDRLIPAFRQAAQDVPRDYFDTLQRLTNLGLALRVRYEFGGDLGDLEESIATHEEAVRLIPCGHPHEPVVLTNLGVLFLRRFRRTHDFTDLVKSISLTEDAVRCTPNHHFDYLSRLASLGYVLLARFQLLGDITDLSRSTFILKDPWLARLEHPERPAILIVFAVSRFAHFHAFHDLDDLDSAIALIKEALGLTPNSHFAHMRMLAMLGFFCSAHFETSGDPTDLNDSITNIQDAIKLTPRGHFDRPLMAIGLCRSLFLHLQVFGWSADLENPVGLLEETVQATSDNNISKPSSLAHLGILFFARFQESDDLPLLDRAISALDRAVQLALQDCMDQLDMLTSLGVMFRARFRASGDVSDLDKSIAVMEEALKLTPVGHGARPQVLTSLGISCVVRAQHLQPQLQNNVQPSG